MFPCQSPAEVRAGLPANTDVVAFQCRNPIHRAHYELFIRALDAPNVSGDGVVLVHPTCGPTQVRVGCCCGARGVAGCKERRFSSFPCQCQTQPLLYAALMPSGCLPGAHHCATAG